jgi:hypothetical protein
MIIPALSMTAPEVPRNKGGSVKHACVLIGILILPNGSVVPAPAHVTAQGRPAALPAVAGSLARCSSMAAAA